MRFEPPKTEEPLPRANQASSIVRQALDKLVAEATAAGWTTNEMVVAIVEATNSFKRAILKDPDPENDFADVSDIPTDGGQLGHGETFD